MTRSGMWLAFGGALSVGAGFLGGMTFGRRTAPARTVAFGRKRSVEPIVTTPA